MIPGAGSRSLLAAALLAAGCLGLHAGSRAVAGEPSPRAAMREGQRLFAAGAYEEAAQAFLRAAESAQARGWDSTPAWMNLGHALHGGGRHMEAQDAYRQAARTEDLPRQARAHYNAGTSLAHDGEALVHAGNEPGALEAFENALQEFDIALRLAPEDAAARVNRDWTEERMQEIKERMQQQPEKAPGEEPPEGRPEEDDDDRPIPEDSGDMETPQEPGQDREGVEDSMPKRGESEGTEPGIDPGTEDDEAQRRPPDPAPEEQLMPSAEEAHSILDALREQEEAQRRELRLRLGAPEPIERDW